MLSQIVNEIDKCFTGCNIKSYVNTRKSENEELQRILNIILKFDGLYSAIGETIPIQNKRFSLGLTELNIAIDEVAKLYGDTPLLKGVQQIVTDNGISDDIVKNPVFSLVILYCFLSSQSFRKILTNMNNSSSIKSENMFGKFEDNFEENFIKHMENFPVSEHVKKQAKLKVYDAEENKNNIPSEEKEEKPKLSNKQILDDSELDPISDRGRFSDEKPYVVQENGITKSKEVKPSNPKEYTGNEGINKNLDTGAGETKKEESISMARTIKELNNGVEQEEVKLSDPKIAKEIYGLKSHDQRKKWSDDSALISLIVEQPSKRELTVGNNDYENVVKVNKIIKKVAEDGTEIGEEVTSSETKITDGLDMGFLFRLNEDHEKKASRLERFKETLQKKLLISESKGNIVYAANPDGVTKEAFNQAANKFIEQLDEMIACQDVNARYKCVTPSESKAVKGIIMTPPDGKLMLYTNKGMVMLMLQESFGYISYKGNEPELKDAGVKVSSVKTKKGKADSATAEMKTTGTLSIFEKNALLKAGKFIELKSIDEAAAKVDIRVSSDLYLKAVSTKKASGTNRYIAREAKVKVTKTGSTTTTPVTKHRIPLWLRGYATKINQEFDTRYPGRRAEFVTTSNTQKTSGASISALRNIKSESDSVAIEMMNRFSEIYLGMTNEERSELNPDAKAKSPTPVVDEADVFKK